MMVILGRWAYLEDVGYIPLPTPDIWNGRSCFSTHIPHYFTMTQKQWSQPTSPSILPWLRNNGAKLPRIKFQKLSQISLFSCRLNFLSHFVTIMKNWLEQDEHFMLFYSVHFDETNEFGLSPVFLSIMTNIYCLAKFACSTFSERQYVKNVSWKMVKKDGKYQPLPLAHTHTRISMHTYMHNERRTEESLVEDWRFSEVLSGLIESKGPMQDFGIRESQRASWKMRWPEGGQKLYPTGKGDSRENLRPQWENYAQDQVRAELRWQRDGMVEWTGAFNQKPRNKET